MIRIAVAAASVLGVAVGVTTFAAQDTRVTFDVASVKRNVSGPGPAPYRTLPNGLTATNYPLKWLIGHAYGIPIPDLPYRLIGGPERILEAQFDINAKAPENTRSAPVDAAIAARGAFRVHIPPRDT